MKTAEQFLDILASKDLVEEKIIAQLQAQAKQATAKGKPLAAEKVADLLIEKEYLTNEPGSLRLQSTFYFNGHPVGWGMQIEQNILSDIIS